MKSILLQCKFLLVEFLNISYQLVPNPLRNYYLRMFGIQIWGGQVLYSSRMQVLPCRKNDRG